MIKEIHFNSKVIGFHDSEPKLINTYQWCSGERKEAGVLPSWSPPSVLSLMKCQNISCACPSIHLQYLFKIFSGTYHLLSTKGTAVNKTGGPCPPCPLRVYSLAKKMPMKVLVDQSCPTLCRPMDCSLPGCSVHRILQARILEWVAIFFSRGSSWHSVQIQVCCVAGRFFIFWATREAPAKKIDINK